MNKIIKINIPQYKSNQSKTTDCNLGRLGRVNLTLNEGVAKEKDILGRLGRLFVTPYVYLEREDVYGDIYKEYENAVPSVPNVPTEGKLVPVDEPTAAKMAALNERMAMVGENCEPEEVKPYVTDFGVLAIPFNSNKKYHYWDGGQSVCDTLLELGRCDLIDQYKSIYKD